MWECFEGFTDRQNPYVCSHMALFAKACEEELTRTFGSVDLVRGGEPCRRVQDGCTGGGAGTGLKEYYIQFPVLLERDKCTDVLAAEGGGPFLDSYDAQCSDAEGCSAELSQVCWSPPLASSPLANPGGSGWHVPRLQPYASPGARALRRPGGGGQPLVRRPLQVRH